MASNGPVETNVKVHENEDSSDVYYASTSKFDAGEHTKHRTISHDNANLSKFGYVPNDAALYKSQRTHESKGNE